MRTFELVAANPVRDPYRISNAAVDHPGTSIFPYCGELANPVVKIYAAILTISQYAACGILSKRLELNACSPPHLGDRLLVLLDFLHQTNCHTESPCRI